MCTVDSCNPHSGCVNVQNECLCDDFDACTEDSCNPWIGCVYDPVSCEYGESCDSLLGCIAERPQ
jgi:hypothetical protein